MISAQTPATLAAAASIAVAAAAAAVEADDVTAEVPPAPAAVVGIAAETGTGAAAVEVVPTAAADHLRFIVVDPEAAGLPADIEEGHMQTVAASTLRSSFQAMQHYQFLLSC